MPKQLSAITILCEIADPHRYILVRRDFPDMDREYVWCGRGAGWHPRNAMTEIIAKVFHSEAEAKQAAGKLSTLPLQE